MPELKIILRLSLYQLHYLQVEPYAAVNEGVSMTKNMPLPVWLVWQCCSA